MKLRLPESPRVFLKCFKWTLTAKLFKSPSQSQRPAVQPPPRLATADAQLRDLPAVSELWGMKISAEPPVMGRLMGIGKRTPFWPSRKWNFEEEKEKKRKKLGENSFKMCFFPLCFLNRPIKTETFATALNLSSLRRGLMLGHAFGLPRHHCGPHFRGPTGLFFVLFV